MTIIADRSGAEGLLELTPVQLDALFRGKDAGPIPQGDSAGTIIVMPGTSVAKPLNAVVGRFAWRGKVFSPDSGEMQNKVTPLSIRAVRARVYEAPSWRDDRPCVVLDYSETSKVAGWIRDEIRAVEPGLYLGIAWGVGRLFGGRRRILRFALTFG